MFTSSPFNEFFRLRRGIDSLFDQFGTANWPSSDEFGGPMLGTSLGLQDQPTRLLEDDSSRQVPLGGEDQSQAMTQAGGQGEQSLVPCCDLHSGQLATLGGGGMTPIKLDIIDKQNAYEIVADIPGVPKENIKVSVHENRLTIEGERRSEKDYSKQNFRRVERSFGRVSRTIQLPRNADASNVKARMGDHNVLHIEVAKRPGSQPKQIPLGESSQQPAGAPADVPQEQRAKQPEQSIPPQTDDKANVDTSQGQGQGLGQGQGQGQREVKV